jgi:hypothetical protein
MPPRFAYWTIILDGAPTSFRTKDREEILPLFNQLKAKNPGALLKWFSGGTLWDSPEQAREARELEKVRRFREERSRQIRTERRPGSSPRPGSAQADPESQDPLAEFRRQHGRPADGSDQKPPARPRGPGSSGPGAARRGRDWRPGGEHRDPRDRYKLPPGESRKRWKERNLGPRGPKPSGPERWSPGSSDPRSPKAQPHGRPKPFGRKPGGDRPWSDRPGGPPSTRGGDDRSLRPRKPFGSKPGGRGKPPGGRGKPPGGSRGKR